MDSRSELSCQHRIENGMFVRDRPVTQARGTLLFVHGLGESGLCFEHLLDHPGLRQWRLLVPDLPGYGRSPWPREPLGLDDQADRLARWLRQEKSSPAALPIVVVGHSMAGVTALLVGERHPEIATAVVDVDGNVSLGDCVFSRLVARQDLPAFLDRGFEQQRGLVFKAGADDRAQRGYYVSMRLADPRSYYRNSLELVAMSEREDMAGRLAALPMPAHYIAGVPGGACRRTLELLAAAGVACTRIEPSGHWPFIDQPDAFVTALLEFLDRSL
jgi:pimeloyl-ACP methyl ester carboxylesterase